jgi:hypothetical protein
MAEFKLGRIRFVWKGPWTTGTQYLVDDVVSNGGKSYICVVNHTASGLFGTDLDNIPTKWNIVADGTQWLGDWNTDTYYNPGAVVKYGALVYICNTAHASTDPTATLTATGITLNGTTGTISFATQPVQPYLVGATITLAGFSPTSTSGAVNTVNTTFVVTACTPSSVTFALTGTYTASTLGTVSGTSQLGLEKDLSKWDLFAESFNWAGNWDTNTRYRKNDFVLYGSSTYVCISGHVSDASAEAGLEFNADKWDAFNTGVVYLGEWNASSVRYKINDIVKFGANLYICVNYHVSDDPFDESKWDIFVNGFEYENSWDNATVYQPGDTVTYGGYSYISKTNHSNKQPTTNATDWAVFTTGFKFIGEWDNSANYLVGNVIRRGAYTYVALLDNSAEDPASSIYWALLNRGFRWTNTPQTYSEVVSTTTVGIGSGAKFNVTRSGTVYSVTIATGFEGTNYVANDKVKVLGSAVGGISPVNDVTITVLTATAGAINSISWTGGSVTWTTGTEYLFGDVVTFGGSSYVCVDLHTSNSGTRPDADLTGDYWNLLAAGAESNLLTETGDTLYYGENGPTRLPVGINGQVLRSQDGFPVWANYGLINNLVYVGPLGVDTPYPEAGATIDQPWKTIQFATKQIENGYLNPQSKQLIEINKQYIMKEITQWVIYTYTVTVTASNSASDTFTCSSTANLVANMPIKFTGTIGGVTAGTTYFVKTVINGTSFTISNLSGGTLRQLNDGTGSMTGTLSYDQALCERDVGLIVDAVKYDLSHGGNAKTTAAAKAYYTTAGNAYINSNFGAQATQTIAAYNYLNELLIDIITNTSGTSYQTTNGVVNPIPQTIDNNLTAETGATIQITSLLVLIISGIQAGAVSAIAAPIFGNTTISVKTGTYNEVLPMVIPEYTAIVGDELRSTVVQPSPAIPELVNDIRVSVGALGHVRSFAANLVTNQPVTPTGANPIIQNTSLPAGNVGSLVAFQSVVSNTALIRDILENGLTRIPTFVLPTPTNYNTSLTDTAYASTGNATGATLNYGDGRAQIVQNYEFMKDEIAAFITVNGDYELYASSDQIKTKRDVGYILDAIQYDITYGGNRQSLIAGRAYYSNSVLQLRAPFLADTLTALNRLKTIIALIVTKGTITPTAGNTTPRVTSGTAGSAGAGTFAQQRVQDVIDWINNAAANATIDSYKAGASSALQTSHAKVLSKRSEIASDAVVWIKKFYQSTAFDELLAARDAGDIVDALSYDLLYGSNFNSLTAGRRYLAPVTSALVVVNSLLEETSRSINFIGWKTKMIAGAGAVAQAASIIDDIAASISGVVSTTLTAVTTSTNYLTVTSTEDLYVNMPVRITGLSGSAGGIINNRTYWINSIVNATTVTLTTAYQSGTAFTISATVTGLTATFTAGEFAEVNGTLTYDNTVDIIKGGEVLRKNASFIAYETLYYVKTTFGGTVTTTTASNNRFTTSAPHNLKVGDPVVFTGGIIAVSGVVANVKYWVLTTPTTSTFTLTAINGSPVEIDITTNGTGSMPVEYYLVEQEWLDKILNFAGAIVYDLNYTGNYKSERQARLYNSAVMGSRAENMFLVSNGSGLRNCTLSGLVGELSPVNSFGTKRPTAGAYVSLNPGFGPNDSNVWVNTRSHYSQNVSMFGTGCTGAKIDGAIHAGGNRSMVKNDFTTIISDGFGVWCTGANSLTELVSVFNYYGYAGYMAELGGRIRATNGNSSYGTYGVIAEGTDTYEQPIYAILDNKAQAAFATEVITDGNDPVWRVEFANAGTNYTNATIDIAGAGVNATAVADEFRDAGVFETRLVDLNDGNGYGGTNYVNAINAAQSGDTVSITIANSDVALSAAYPAMRIQLTAGSGVGQYANILTYNNGTKVAQVYKDSFETLIVTATSVTNNLLTVASTATLFAGMRIYLTGTMSGTGGATGLSANVPYYIRTANFSATQFSVSTVSASGTAVTISNNVSALTISVLAAGWDHVIPGRSIAAGLDLTTGYIIEPRISYSHPGYVATARSLIGTATWSRATYGNSKFVAIASSATTTNYSLDGKTWATGGALSASATWNGLTYGGGEGATATAVVGGLGGQGAVLTAVMGVTNSIGNPGADQVVSVTIVNGGVNYTTPPTIVFTPVSGGSGATATCTVLNGKIDTVTVSINGSGYSVAPTVAAATDRVSKVIINSRGKNYGNGSTAITFTNGGSSNQATGTVLFTNSGVSSVIIGNAGGTGYTSTPTVTITDTNAKFVAIASGTISTSYLSATDANNAAWTGGGNLPVGFTAAAAIAYGVGVWVVIGGTASGASSTTAASWVARTLPTTSGTWSSVAFGAGRFVAVSTGAQATAYSTNGSTWVAGGNLPSSTTWTSVAFGNGRWVAVASGGRTTAYSLDNGLTWTAATPGLPSSQTWVNIKYAQGVFVAVANSSTVCAVSSDGISWYSRTMPGSSTNWQGLAFGNPGNVPLWVSVSATSGTTAASINTGARALGRMKSLSGEVIEVRMIEPGSSYPKGTVSATTASTNLITANITEKLVDLQPVSFTGLDDYGLVTEAVYYVIGATITSTQFKVSLVAGSGTPIVLTTGTTLSGTYRASPIVTQFDPNKVVTAPLTARTSDGVLANPTFTNRGTGYTTATIVVGGDGYADLYQPSTFVAVRNLYQVPQAGSNVVFNSISGIWHKLVAVSNVLGEAGAYTANFQISPGLSVLNAPKDGDLITTTIKYSQVRLTGHDFLYIGTGNQTQTNYPFVDPTTASIAAQTNSSGGGRVFFTSTDQDGNFNVGGLFGVQQSTGTATLNADAFNLSGLQSLQLTGLTVGTGSATISQFSTDPYFTADSDNIVPTQRAIKAYITAQIGGGQSSLNVNTLTSGVIYVANDSISTTSGGQLNIKSKMNFTGGIDGAPVALGFFLSR